MMVSVPVRHTLVGKKKRQGHMMIYNDAGISFLFTINSTGYLKHSMINKTINKGTSKTVS